MIDNKVKKYSEELEKLGIRHEVVEHPDLRTPAEVQGFLGLTLADGLSTMIMRADEEFVAVIRRDDCRMDFEAIKKVLGAANLRMAKPAEFTKLTGLPLGAARVFNRKLKTLLDKRLFEKELLTGGTGSFTCSFRYKAEDLRKIPNSVVVEVTKIQEEVESVGRKRIFSGIRATGRLHLGNYLGAVKGMLALQDDSQYEMFFAVVDVHAMTTPYDKTTLGQKTREVVLDYLAAGMDPTKSGILVQSKVADLHAELMLYFSTVVNVARMQHLPTFKEKVKQYPQNVTMALLNYPILMAADILAYKSELVPTGIDQEPHLEVAREIARKMNEHYGTDFPEPKRFASPGEYVPSLTGEGKMSKSVEGSYINLTDDLATIKGKLTKMPTDSGKGERVPASGGIANLLAFVELFMGQEKRKEYERLYTGEGIRYQELKAELAEAIYRELEPIQKRRRELEAKPEYVDKVIEEGAKRARKIAEETVREVREKMGLE